MQEAIEDNEISLLLGVDISSAFDCLDRNKLIRQMKVLGFGEEAIILIESYFRDRTMQVEIGGHRGPKRESRVGVLQGSGLSPIFFLLYFLRASVAIRTCNSCKNKLRLRTKD